MPSRKQRRRREKSLRHEYEFVYVDDEGKEVEVDPAEVERPQAKKANGAPVRRGARPTRTVPPPSWQRVGKRALIFAPFMYIILSVIGAERNVAARIVQTVILLAFFLPFSYVMDSFMYRTYLKRGGKPPPDAKPPADRPSRPRGWLRRSG